MSSARLHRSAFLTGMVVVGGQRVGVPVGDTHVSLSVVALAVFFCGLLVGGWPLSRGGLCVWLVLCAVGGAALLRLPSSSVTSLLMMLLCYLPLLLLPTEGAEPTGAGADFFNGALTATTVGAGLAVVQAALQWLGSANLWDPIATLVPRGLQVSGYNSLYSLEYVDADLGLAYKPNGVIFLEPSFVSMYCALGLVWVAHRWLSGTSTASRGLGLVAATLLLGLIISISSTGLPLLGLGLLGLAPRLVTNIKALAFMCALGAVTLATGLTEGIVAKASEGAGENTSTALRLTLPYQLLTSNIGEAPLLGHGPGTATGMVAELGITGLQVPTILKAALEYGLLGAAAFALALALVVWSSRPPAGLGLALVGAWLIPAEALLNAPVVALLFFALAHARDSQPRLQAVRVTEPDYREQHA